MFSSEEILSVIDSLSVSNYTFTMLSYIEYPSWIRPEVVSFLPVRWYAVMYIVAFAIAYLLFRYQVRHDGRLEMSKDDSENMFLLCIVLLLVGEVVAQHQVMAVRDVIVYARQQSVHVSCPS